MAHDNNALDCLFGPYDFLDTAQPPMGGGGAGQPPHELMQGRANDGYGSGGSGGGRRRAYPYMAANHEMPPTGGYPVPRPMGRTGRMIRSDHERPPSQMMEMMGLPEVGGLPPMASPPPPQQPPPQQPGPPGVGGVQAPDMPASKRQRLQPQTTGDAELQDKADRCRARNREHARQTRRRKKEFVESLQVSVQQLDHENKIMAARLQTLDERAQERERRADAVASILSLRVKDCEDPDAARQWADLVESDFELKLPHTPYRSFPPYESTANGRTVCGIPACMADVMSLRVCLGALKRRIARKESATDAARKHSEAAVAAAAKEQQQAPPVDPQSCSSSGSDNDAACETECILERANLAWATDGSLMAPWMLRVSDAKHQVILQQRGHLRAAFRGRSSTLRGGADHSTSGDDDRSRGKERVAMLELSFDTMSLWRQLQRGTRPERLYKPVPNTLDQALQPSDEARVITSASRPFVIEYVNGPWTKLCGYDTDECVGKTLGIIQGPETSTDDVTKLTSDAAKGHATSAVLTNYAKDGQKFQNYVRVFPLVDDDGSTKVSHMLGILQNVVN